MLTPHPPMRDWMRRRSSAVTTDYQPQAELLHSPLWGLLYDADGKPVNGTWVPTWMRSATGTEARARVLAEILWWFEVAHSDRVTAREHPDWRVRLRSRARVYDHNGQQWLAVTKRELARRAMVPQRTGLDALNTLGGFEIIHVVEQDDTVLARPNGHRLAQLYHDVTGDRTAFDEFLSPTSPQIRSEWTGSRTQHRACHVAPGVTVHNGLVSFVGNDLFHARLLSQLLYRFGDREGRCKAKVKLRGNLWWAESYSNWARELGVAEKSVERAVESLVARGLVRKCVSYYRAGRAESRPTTHLRPDVEAILNRMQQENLNRSHGE